MEYIESFVHALTHNPNLKKAINLLRPAAGNITWKMRPFKKTQKPPKSFYYFNCPNKKKGLCITLRLGSQTYGYLVLRNLKQKLPENLFSMLSVSMEILLRETQKEMELKKLYQTTIPRMTALSTIHTVHRLVSANPESEDLIPKIARLCLQMMRCEKCSISMLDQQRRLIPVARVSAKGSLHSSKQAIAPSKIEAKIINTGSSKIEAKRLLVPLVDEDVMGIVSVSQKTGGGGFTQFDNEILHTFAEQAVIAIKNTQLYEDQKKIILGSIKSLTSLLDTHTPFDYKPSGVFIDLTTALSEEMGLPASMREIIHYAAYLHDTGKVTVPDRILKKPKRLTGKEYDIIKKHPVKGAEIIKPLDALKPAIPIILSHHERYDGKGYPRGMKKNQIPIGARIMAVADAFVSMTTQKPYRTPMSVSEAVSEIIKNSGTQFDPKVADAFMRLVKSGKLKKILKKKRANS